MEQQNNKCGWCGKFLEEGNYDGFCDRDERCHQNWFSNTDDDGKKLPKDQWIKN